MIMLLLKSFFKTLKSELLSKDAFKTRREAKTKVFEYIEVYYNKRRIHSTLNWCSPKEYLENHYKKTGKREESIHHREKREAVMLWPSGGICLKYQTAAGYPAALPHPLSEDLRFFIVSLCDDGKALWYSSKDSMVQMYAG